MERETYTVTREIRNGTAHWVHVKGASFNEAAAGRAARAEAKKWARELGHERAYVVSGGGQYGTDSFRHSVCLGFE
ncbi:hypothetical protein [Streptomyces sp. 5-10]|uniref:hypothetical protein n=1 Tax=Streptomyces sp. 5-10 TaxID=878925 RepID=UPI00168B9F71|nr:hypothetical protein [Streptomyces sp. 5-10]MBD3004566.1 hypothetical protein [Streptomyces sp. 5-10]